MVEASSARLAVSESSSVKFASDWLSISEWLSDIEELSDLTGSPREKLDEITLSPEGLAGLSIPAAVAVARFFSDASSAAWFDAYSWRS